MIEIKYINAETTYSVRKAVLRKGKTCSSCLFEGDNLTSTIHYGLFIDKELAGIISLFENKFGNFTTQKQLQIRGMAVLESHQKKGFGNLLVIKAEEYAKTKKMDVIWFNARETAVGFYEKLGYQIIDKSFIIEGIGTHYIMYKML
jgi:ribosomal protein S18 acetylase RimI-like enzyme